ncbi:Gmad2 immunoglobulin-like domain-containing protein [Thermoflavimicrobium dichotomicum]|uniref:Immunoglobulin-like domain of spore germination n=1 Tax=Thermoflavimicrobium dichotomicum TaxID=46223 RepID=A0A1I3RZN7_9BACL|nr:Gmad2 immunoglobulin-like domain-containing protein [Thermoflavimicrobium dichotomicum]SFJ51510.1 Immunoglobulin-like domain of spore germination [Thermoflavimicrobium dichotomicum]
MKRFWAIMLCMVWVLVLAPTAVFAADEHFAFREVKIKETKVEYLVTGEAKVFEGTYHYLVRAGKQVLVKGHGRATAGAPKWGKWQQKITLSKEQIKGKKNVTLELYEKSAKDGKAVNQLIIPLNHPFGKEYQNRAFRHVKVAEPNVIYVVTGKARVFEGVYSYIVEDGHDVLVKGSGQASAAAPAWGTFKQEIAIKKSKLPHNGSIILTLYQKDLSGRGAHLHSYSLQLDQFPW